MGAISQMHGYILSADGCFRFRQQLITSRNYQETPLGASVLDGRAHESVKQLFEDDLARDDLRHLDDGREVERFNRRLDRGCRNEQGLLRPKVRIELVELPRLAIGAPAEIPIPGFQKICIRYL